jgi:hypothetical protein
MATRALQSALRGAARSTEGEGMDVDGGVGRASRGNRRGAGRSAGPIDQVSLPVGVLLV